MLAVDHGRIHVLKFHILFLMDENIKIIYWHLNMILWMRLVLTAMWPVQ